MSTTPTPAQSAAATRLRAGYLANASAARPIDAKTTWAALDGMTQLLADMDGHTGASAYYQATQAAVEAAGPRPAVRYSAAHGGNDARAWDATVDARLAVDLAMLAAGLDPERVRAQAATLADATEDGLEAMTREAAAELATTSAARRAYGARLAAAVALVRTARSAA